MPFLMFLMALSQFLFINRLSNEQNDFVQIPLWITLAYMVLPVRILYKACDSIEDAGRSHLSYDDHYTNFKTDYESANPVSFNQPNIIVRRPTDVLSKKAKIPETTDPQNGISSKNLNIASLLNYAKMGTLNERVGNMYQDLSLFIKADSNLANNLRHIINHTLQEYNINLRNSRALDNLK